MAKANKLSTCERRAGGDCSPLGGGLRLGRGTLGGFGSGSFRTAFLAERLCFANLTLSFLEVLILARRSNKEPSEYTVYLGPPMKQRTVSAHCPRRLFELWMVARLSVSSRRCAGCGTDICCAGPLLSLLRPIARLSEIEGHGAARWQGPSRRPEKVAGTAIWGGPRYTGRSPYAMPDRNCGPRRSVLVNATKAPRKIGLGPLFGVMRTRASPAKSGAS